MASREELKAEVERIGQQNGHALGPWLEVGHAAQVGCMVCDRYGFFQVLPPPGKAMPEGLAAPCPDRGGRLINTPD